MGEAARCIDRVEYAWSPHAGPQAEFSRSREPEVLYGGQAGGGKSDILVMEGLRYTGYSRYKGLILRRTFPQLEELLDRAREYYPHAGGSYKASEHRWFFPSGASINFGHMADAGSEYNYQGKEFQYIAFDELGQFLPAQYLYLWSRCRTTTDGIVMRVRGATNPGGPSHQFLKDRFRIGQLEPRTIITDPETGLTRKFIPAAISDNPTLLENDPDYVRRLMMLPEVERMRLLEGIWDAFEGQVFSELNRDVHGMDPISPLPADWSYYRCFDWGYSAPYACYWIGVDHDGILYLVHELYGAKSNEHGWVGVRQSDAEMARAILNEEEKLGVKVNPGPADPRSLWSVQRRKGQIMGPRPAETFQQNGVVFLKGDNDRIAGKRQFHERLRLDEDGRPGIYIFNSCTHFWRTIPLLCESKTNPEDVDTASEDHIYDCVRYGLMFRPMRPRHQVRSDAGTFQAERRKYIRAKQLASRYGISISSAYGRLP